MKNRTKQRRARLISVSAAFVVCVGLFASGSMYMSSHPHLFAGLSSRSMQSSLLAAAPTKATPSNSSPDPTASVALADLIQSDSLDLTTPSTLPGSEINLRGFNLAHKQWLDVAADAPSIATDEPLNSSFSLVPDGTAYQIRSAGNQCVTVAGNTSSPDLRMRSCADESQPALRAQQAFLSLGQVGGGIVLQSTFTGTAITASFASQRVQLAPVSGVAQQRWLLLPAS